MQTTPSGDTAAVQLSLSISSHSTTRRGPKMRGVDPDFAACRARHSTFLGGSSEVRCPDLKPGQNVPQQLISRNAPVGGSVSNNTFVGGIYAALYAHTPDI
jgi:hypothetical protein